MVRDFYLLQFLLMLLWNQAFPSLNHTSRTKHVITAGSVSMLAQQRHLRETDSIRRAASRKLFEDAQSVYKFVKDKLRPPTSSTIECTLTFSISLRHKSPSNLLDTRGFAIFSLLSLDSNHSNVQDYPCK